MSGIFGIWNLDGRPVENAVLTRMSVALAHRGGDGEGVWSQGSVGLGHRLLRTTPESVWEQLPLSNGASHIMLTADARIDNRDELLVALNLNSGERITDSRLILLAYDRWGENSPQRLLGDFAFAIWDGARQVLFFARDHFGVKPFYYYLQPGTILVFASEIKALLCVERVPQQLNELRLAEFLLPLLMDKATTFYQGILRLPPGHSMTVTQNQEAIRPYWSLDRSRVIRMRSDREYAEGFREIFSDAVRCRLRSAFPVGSMLSGGLDSSSITCVARQLTSQDEKRKLHTFSAIFDDVPECDERLFINTVVSLDGLAPHYLHADQVGPFYDIERVLYHQDEPFWAPNLFMHWGLYSQARTQGVRVLLDGFDGDTTVWHGFELLAELALAGRLWSLLTELRQVSRRVNTSAYRMLRGYVVQPLVPQPVQQAWRWLRGRDRPAWMMDKTINPDFAKRVGLADRAQALLGDRLRPLCTRDAHWQRITDGLIPLTLEVVDKAASAFSLEARYPFFDRRLVEFCVALPAEQKLHQGWTRVVMRRAMGNILPEEVRWRGGKSDIGPNFDRGLALFDRKLLDEVIFDDPSDIEPYVNLGALRQAYARCAFRGQWVDTLAVWKWVLLALWLRSVNAKGKRAYRDSPVVVGEAFARHPPWSVQSPG